MKSKISKGNWYVLIAIAILFFLTPRGRAGPDQCIFGWLCSLSQDNYFYWTMIIGAGGFLLIKLTRATKYVGEPIKLKEIAGMTLLLTTILYAGFMPDNKLFFIVLVGVTVIFSIMRLISFKKHRINKSDVLFLAGLIFLIGYVWFNGGISIWLQPYTLIFWLILILDISIMIFMFKRGYNYGI